jgi:hypothetical protein
MKDEAEFRCASPEERHVRQTGHSPVILVGF